MGNARQDTQPPAPSALERCGLIVVDLLTAIAFAWTWIAPGSVFFADVNSMGLVYMVEFASLHAAGFLVALIFAQRIHRGLRVLGICVLGAVYVGLFASLGVQSGVWWPAGVLLIFVTGKIWHVMFRPTGSDSAFHYGVQWAVATGLFVLLTGLAFALPWPHLGITPDPQAGKVLADGATQGSAHVVIVAGTLYFSAVAAVKYRFAAYFLRGAST